jgi:uncharacterized membrane protein YuzA (DUF378 family)
MSRFNGLDWTASVLTIVGALNWGLVGLFQFDLVAALFGGPSALLSRVIYTLVGISGLYMTYSLTKLGDVERRRALS